MAVELSVINSLTPLSSLTQNNKQQLAQSCYFQKIPAGTLLFSKGDKQSSYIYLIEGAVELTQGNNMVSLLKTNNAPLRAPIDNNNPHLHSAICKKNSTILDIKTDKVDKLMTWDKTGTFEVEELNLDADGMGVEFNNDSVTDDDWMSAAFNIPVFKKLPADKLQTIFTSCEKINMPTGEKVVSQGQEGDFFYVLLKGECIIMRATPKNPNGIKLGMIKSGDNFGADAIISGTTRSATVLTVFPSMLLKISKDDFNNSILEEYTKSVTLDEMKEMQKSSSAVIIDCRNPDECKGHPLPGAINIPLILLRLKMPTAHKDKPLICVCGDGKKSKAANFILSNKGMNCFYLANGLG